MGEAMQAAAGLGMLAWYGSALYVGGRLLRLGAQRDNPHARWIGTYLFAAMGLGGILMSIPLVRVSVGGLSATPLDRTLVALGCTVTAIGNLGLLTFTRRVFRRDSAAAKWSVGGVAAMLVVGTVGHGLTTGFDPELKAPFAVLYILGTILSNAWTSAESLRYYGLMRRRLRMGLVEPLVTQRFLLWGGGAGAAAVILLVSMVELQLESILGPARAETLRGITVPLMSALGLACAGCYLLAFAPAEWYLRRFAGSAQTG